MSKLENIVRKEHPGYYDISFELEFDYRDRATGLVMWGKRLEDDKEFSKRMEKEEKTKRNRLERQKKKEERKKKAAVKAESEERAELVRLKAKYETS